MVMTAPVVLVFVAGDAIVEGDLTGQSALGQQLKGAVDGGVADAGIFLMYKAMQFVGGEVVAGFQKGMQDRVALRRLLQADTLEMPVKDRLGLVHHLARNGRLIINAFLQHEESG